MSRTRIHPAWFVVAMVPPTASLCREIFGESGTIVFGWVFASHHIGAAAAALAAGVVRAPDVKTPTMEPAQM